MMPTLRPGAIVVAWAWPRRIVPGDIVLIRHEGREKVKRIRHADERGIFVIGDNPNLSTDSRDFGWLDRSVIAGKVWWPLLNKVDSIIIEQKRGRV